MILTVSHLNKVYTQATANIHALHEVQLQLEAGKTLSITGPSGSGKTTLLSILAGLEKPTSGKVTINNTCITDLDEKSLSQFRSKNIGIVFQQFHLMPHLTALENVMLPLEIAGKSNPEAVAKDMLEQVGLKARTQHTPNELSGGECQRVAIARALICQPKLLLADEPSGNLDTETGESVTQLLFEIVKNHNMSLVLVTHDQSLADQCEFKIKMHAGKVI